MIEIVLITLSPFQIYCHNVIQNPDMGPSGTLTTALLVESAVVVVALQDPYP
jgi:hypothetical protein